MDNLEPLLKELGCKTPAEEIASDRRDMILDFLKMESEYRRQHKIKRLLSLSGLKAGQDSGPVRLAFQSQDQQG